jgi:excinuclease UvrABC nuclease subunit
MASKSKTFWMSSVELSSFRPIKTLDPLAGGVYAFCNEAGDPVYIGQSGLIQQRIKAHAKKAWRKQATSVVWYPVAGAEDRLVLETLLILRYRPRNNRAVKIGIRADGSIYEIQFVGRAPRPKKK